MKTKLQNLFMAALTLAASTQKLGVNLIRVAILVIFVWIGGLKFWNYEAEGIVPMRLTAIFPREIFSPSERYKAKFTNIMLQTLQNTMMKTNLKSAEFMTSFRQIWKTKRKGLLQKILRIKAVSVSATIRMNSSI